MTSWDELRRRLGVLGLYARPSEREHDALAMALDRGWTVVALADAILTDWPSAVHSPSALVVSRLHYLADLDPPFGVRPRPNPPTPTGPRRPMPDEVRQYLAEAAQERKARHASDRTGQCTSPPCKE